ncbi:MAG: hydroxylamine reductase, partial [Candidatus Omnitrophica bacterium]|nr:hydroxylamine reductase [Candidatus Omnitrophota bacterium]
MFCYQCQETAKGQGCTVKGVCGKEAVVAGYQDVLIYILKGIAVLAEKVKEKGDVDGKYTEYIKRALFTTITNANFDNAKIKVFINEGIALKKE